MSRFYDPVPQPDDNAGASLAGAQLFFYVNETTTDRDTYSDPALTTENANPVVADGNGRFGDIFLGPGLYTVVLKTSADEQIWSRDDVGGDEPLIVTSYSALSALTGMSTGDLARVSAGTGIDGLFRYDSAQSATDNGGTIIDGWVRIYSGSVDVKWFGAVGDGITGDSSALSLAFAYCVSSDETAFMPDGSYKLNAPLTISGALKLIGAGYDTIIDGSGLSVRTAILTITGSETSLTTISSLPANQGDTVVSVSSTSGLSAGNMILFRSTQASSSIVSGGLTYFKGEMAFIESVGSGQITLTSPLQDDYTSGTVSIARADFISGLKISNIRIKGAGVSGQQFGLTVSYARYAQISDVFIEDCEDTGFAFQYCDSSTFNKCDVKRCFGTTNGVGYAFGCDLLTQNSSVINNTCDGVGCGFSTGGLYPARNNIVSSNRFVGAASARPMIQTHINGQSTLVNGNIVTDAVQGIGMFAKNCTVSSNKVSNCTGFGIYLIEEGQVGAKVSDNTVRTSLVGAVIDVYSGSNIPKIDMSDNVFIDLTGGAGISTSCINTTINNAYIEGASPGILCQGSNTEILNTKIIDVGTVGNPYGIHLTGSPDNIKIKGCTIKEDATSNMTFGVIVGSTVTNVEISDCVISDVSEPNAISGISANKIIAKDNIINGARQARHIFTAAATTNATTTGFARTGAFIYYNQNGRIFALGSTDNVWNLTGVSTGAGEYKKIALCLKNGGAASYVESDAGAAQTLALVPENIPWDVVPVAIVEIGQNYSGGSLSGFVFHDFVGNPF